jgi:hypothetical protein
MVGEAAGLLARFPAGFLARFPARFLAAIVPEDLTLVLLDSRPRWKTHLVVVGLVLRVSGGGRV